MKRIGKRMSRWLGSGRTATTAVDPIGAACESPDDLILFDPVWYLAQYPDVATAGVDPLQHYLADGWREGRDPHPLFDTDWYLWMYSDVSAAGVNPMQHFLAHGRYEKRNPNPQFDTDWYLTAYPDVATSGLDPFTHYVVRGLERGMQPCAIAQRHKVTAEAAAPKRARAAATVLIITEGDWIHLQRCVRALARTEVPDLARVVVVDNAGPTQPWHFLDIYPWVSVVHLNGYRAPVAMMNDAVDTSETDYLLLLSPDTEPLPGFLLALLRTAEAHDPGSERDAGRGLVVVPPHPAATFGDNSTDNDEREAATSALLIRTDSWPALAGDPQCGWGLGDSFLDLLRQDRYRIQTSPDATLFTNLPRILGRASGEARLEWDIPTAARAMTRAAGLEPRASAYAELTRIRLAACDPPGAAASHWHWKSELGKMSPAARANQARWVRYMPGFVGDIINESLLAPAAGEAAHQAIIDDDLHAAAQNLRAHPGSFMAAVAVIVILARSRLAEPQRIPADRPDPIPHMVVQAWFDSPLPPDAAAMTRTWQAVNPDWQHRIFDTDSAADWLVRNKGRAVERVFRSASAVSKADLFRQAYLSVEGGVWSDIDDRAVRPLDPLIAGREIVVTVEPTGSVGNNFIAVAPGHPVITATYEHSLRNLSRGFAESIWLANGPGLFTRMVASWICRRSDFGAPGRDLVLIDNGVLNGYVKMFEELSYKDTAQAWDVAASRGEAVTAGRPKADGGHPAGYPAGTPITTPSGCVSVEQLSPGDEVLGMDGSLARVRWNGTRPLTGGQNRGHWVRLAQGCVGSGLPKEEILLPPDLPILMEDIWVRPRALVDGLAVTWQTMGAGSAPLVLHMLEIEGDVPVDVMGVLTDSTADRESRFECSNLAEWYSLPPTAPRPAAERGRLSVHSPRQWAARNNTSEPALDPALSQPLTEELNAGTSFAEPQSGMNLAFHPNDYTLPGGMAYLSTSFAELMRLSDQAGVSAVALMDHFLQLGSLPPSDPMLEGYTALGFAAAQTRSADLMLLVSGVTHRHPVLLAKAVTTLDVLSGGRARLGVGAAWYGHENEVYGLPFPPLGKRFEMLDEALGLITQMWSAANGPFVGEHFRVTATVCSPMPLRRPRPPIIVGGNGPRKTLRLAARHADACNLLAGPAAGGPAEVARKLQTLREHCEAEGSDYDRIAKTILYTSPVAVDAVGAGRFAEEMRAYAELGVEEVFVMPLGGVDPFRFVDGLGCHVIPELQAATLGVGHNSAVLRTSQGPIPAR